MVPRVPFSACLAGYAGDSLVDGYYSLAAGKNTQVGAGWMEGCCGDGFGTVGCRCSVACRGIAAVAEDLSCVDGGSAGPVLMCLLSNHTPP